MRRISIITVNLNNAKGLIQTFASVFSQNYTDFEYVVIDGNSSDGSKGIIAENLNRVDYHIIAEDTGIYHAMNKGIAKATGQWLLFLNSGDTLYDTDTLLNIAPMLVNYGIVYGDLVIKEPTRHWIKKYDKPVSIDYFFRDTLPHQGAFIHKDLFKTVGLYDESGILCSDWKFFLEAVCRYGYEARYIDRIIATYDYTGLSSRGDSHAKMMQERQKILQAEWKPMLSLYEELMEQKRRYHLLANSKPVRLYLALRKKIGLA